MDTCNIVLSVLGVVVRVRELLLSLRIWPYFFASATHTKGSYVSLEGNIRQVKSI